MLHSMTSSMLPLFDSCTITEFSVTSSLVLDNWGQKYCQSLGNKPLLAMNSPYNKKGQWPVPLAGVKTFTPRAARIIIFNLKNLNCLIVCFTRCTLFFQYVCLPCVSCGMYWNEDKCCAVTHHAADIRVAWLVYVRTYCVPIATLNQNKRSPSLYLGKAQIIELK